MILTEFDFGTGFVDTLGRGCIAEMGYWLFGIGLFHFGEVKVGWLEGTVFFRFAGILDLA